MGNGFIEAKGCFVSSLVEIGPVVLEKMKMTSLQTDDSFLSYLSYLLKLESPLLKDALCQIWLKLS